ncbi:MAG: transcription termination factor NusA [Phycisphaerales bacterium]|nr:transcription termination factor NusA [Phycisphaerales bacterium]
MAKKKSIMDLNLDEKLPVLRQRRKQSQEVSQESLIHSFKEFMTSMNVDRSTMMKLLEEMFRILLKKKYGTDDNFDIVTNVEKGDLEIYQNKTIVDDAQASINPLVEIPYSEAIKIEPDFEIGEQLPIKIDINNYERRNILAAKQQLVSRINDLNKQGLIKKYQDRVGEVVTVEVYQVWKKEILLIDDDGNDLILPKSEQIPTDYYKKGDMVKAVIKKVELTKGTPVVILSRTDEQFLEKLMEAEVPEIFDGVIVIKNVKRKPGERAKVVVYSQDDRIDPVGACVGIKGGRIHGIVRELRNENIDIINYTENIQLLIQRSLTPAKVTSITLDRENKHATIRLGHEEISKAIGKGGVNIKLATAIVGYKLDVFRDDEAEQDDFDIDLNEFNDEIEQWIIDEFKKVGIDTAKGILNTSTDELEKRTDLEIKTIIDVKRIIEQEFRQ